MKGTTPSSTSSHRFVTERRWRLIITLLAIAATWIGAFSIVTASRVFSSMYHGLGWGPDFPLPTAATFGASRHHLPWAFAVLATALLGYLLACASRYLTAACAAISIAGMIVVSVATLSLALPHYNLCADIALWPDWPDWRTAASRDGTVAMPALPNPDAPRAPSPAWPCP